MADCCWGKACCVHHLKSVRNKREKWSSRQNHTFLSKTALILFFLTSQHWISWNFTEFMTLLSFSVSHVSQILLFNFCPPESFCHPPHYLVSLFTKFIKAETGWRSQFLFSSLPLLILPTGTSQAHLLCSNCTLARFFWTILVSHPDFWGNAQTDLHVFVMPSSSSFSQQ